MSDSFFTTRNLADPQFDGSPSILVQQFLEAGIRRIATLEGPIEASKRAQRLADICAGAYVLPIEHWAKAPAEVVMVTPAAPISWFKRIKGYLTDNTVFAFWLGFFFGCFVSGGRPS